MSDDITMAADGGAVRVTIGVEQMEDEHSAFLLNDVPAFVARSGGVPALIDLSAVTWMPSSIIGTFVSLFGKLGQKRDKMILVSPQPRVLESLRICNLDRLFTVAGSMDEAREMLA